MKLEFRKIKKDDARAFIEWGSHEDPRYYQYNFPYTCNGDFDAWYYSKQKWITRKVYGLFLDDHPLGFVTLKNINWFSQRAELGIAIDPNHVSEGFGSELLKRFLNYVFTVYPIQTMSLRVAHFNHRAQKSYLKIGFEIVGEAIEPYEEQGYRDVIMKKYPEQFDLIDDVLYTNFHIMSISKSNFINKYTK